MGSMLRILHLLSSKNLSGAENLVADICMMFDQELEMIYCSPFGPIKAALDERKVRYWPLNKMSVSELRKVLANQDIGIIHAHDIKASILAALAAKKLPIISHIHVNSNAMSKLSLKAISYLFASLKFNRIIVVSQGCLDGYIFNRMIRKKVVLLPNIIFPDRLVRLIDKDINEYKFDFIYVGRLTYQKNPERVAKVAAMVLKKCIRARFGVIGDGELRDKMVEIFKEQKLLDRVIFTGKLEYPYKAMSSAKCKLLCSRYEGMPISVLECLALGVPVVSNLVDGVQSIIVNNKNGFISDDDYEIAEKIINIINYKELYERLSHGARETFRYVNDHFGYKRKLKEIYLSIIREIVY